MRIIIIVVAIGVIWILTRKKTPRVIVTGPTPKWVPDNTGNFNPIVNNNMNGPTSQGGGGIMPGDGRDDTMPGKGRD